MNKGLFITFEGPDGSGKTTQINACASYMREKGYDVVLTHEPGGTPVGERIRELLLDPKNKGMDDVCEALLYAASRAEHVKKVILPALRAGKAVISDRYIDSSYAYQGAGRGLGDAVRVWNEYAIREAMPDLTVLLLLDPEEGRKRIEARVKTGGATELDRIEMEKLEFHTKVYERYKALAEEEPERIALLDANDTIESIASRVQARLDGLL